MSIFEHALTAMVSNLIATAESKRIFEAELPTEPGSVMTSDRLLSDVHDMVTAVHTKQGVDPGDDMPALVFIAGTSGALCLPASPFMNPGGKDKLKTVLQRLLETEQRFHTCLLVSPSWTLEALSPEDATQARREGLENHPRRVEKIMVNMQTRDRRCVMRMYEITRDEENRPVLGAFTEKEGDFQHGGGRFSNFFNHTTTGATNGTRH